jgi:reactive chlorine resistance protein C
MEALFRFLEGVARPALRFSLAIVLLWIGGLKFVDPTPVVGLLQASLPFLAFPAVVYALGFAEVCAAVALVTGAALRWVGLLCVGLFLGTLTIFVVAPAVSFGDAGFPNLTLAGEFLLKDLVLLAASIAIATQVPVRAHLDAL